MFEDDSNIDLLHCILEPDSVVEEQRIEDFERREFGPALVLNLCKGKNSNDLKFSLARTSEPVT